MAVQLLKTFGGLDLVGADGSPSLPESAQRRLVLLALAAEAGERGLPRDRAIAFLWPEADEEHARRSLNQLRYTLRREVGTDPLIGTLTLRLDPEVASSDIEQFRAAIAAGDVQRAAALHVAPFLDGVPLGGSAELDEWADGCRAEARRMLARLLEQKARAAQSAGDSQGAERLWRQLIQLEPLSATHAIGLMESLAARGDASGALLVAGEHEAVVRRELGVPPDASVAAAASRIRARTAASPARPTPAPPASLPRTQADLAVAPVEAPPAAVAGALPSSRTSAASRPGRSARRAAAWAALGVLLLAGFLLVRQRKPGVAAPSASVVAVLPFTVHGGTEYEYLREGMVTLLSAKLGGERFLRPADGHAVVSLARRQKPAAMDQVQASALARQLGAGSFVIGDVVGVDGRLRLEAVAYRVGSDTPVARSGVEGPASALFALVDSLATGLLEGLTGGPERSHRLTAGTTSSLPALKAYLEGEQLFRSGHALEAFDAFERAAALDTTFALASYWASVAGWWADQSEIVVAHADRAVRHAGRVGERDRRLLVAWDTLMHGDPTESERIYRAVLGVEPDNVAAWSQLGEVLFHYAPRRGSPLSAARTAFERVLTYEPRQPGALLHLARIASADRVAPRLDSLTNKFDLTDSTGEWREELAVLQAATRRDSAGLARAATTLSNSPDGRIWAIGLDGWRATHSASLTEPLLDPLTSSSRTPESRALGEVSLAWLALAVGRLEDARTALGRAAVLDTITAYEHRALMVLMPFVPTSAAELDAMRQVLVRWDPELIPRRFGATHVGGVHDDAHRVIRDYLVGSLSAKLKDEAEAERRAAMLDRTTGAADLVEYARAAAASIRGQVALATGQAARGSAILARSLALETRITRAGASAFYLRGLERYLLAESLQAQGRSDDAERWYRTFTSSYFDIVYEAPALVHLGELAEARRESGDPYYALAFEIWRDADEAFAPEVAGARRAAQIRARTP
jgi:DNA-binding SARP family transcriptional activator